ncbi:unnamed protein product [Closterium sp. Naga37s-1]|nr:unnamed protein product [Closterium sp. Naga37s-1]
MDGNWTTQRRTRRSDRSRACTTRTWRRAAESTRGGNWHRTAQGGWGDAWAGAGSVGVGGVEGQVRREGLGSSAPLPALAAAAGERHSRRHCLCRLRFPPSTTPLPHGAPAAPNSPQFLLSRPLMVTCPPNAPADSMHIAPNPAHPRCVDRVDLMEQVSSVEQDLPDDPLRAKYIQGTLVPDTLRYARSCQRALVAAPSRRSPSPSLSSRLPHSHPQPLTLLPSPVRSAFFPLPTHIPSPATPSPSYLSRLLSVRVLPPDPLLLPVTCATFTALSNGSSACTQLAPMCDAEVDIDVDPSLLAAHSLCQSEDPATCGEVAAGTGTLGADIILFLSAKQTATCGSTTAAAHASHCAVDPASNRPLAASLNLCPLAWRAVGQHSPSYDSQVHAVLHQLTHALAFSSALFPLFKDVRGQPYAQVVATARQADGSNVSKIVTPAVVAAAQRHFDCPALDGAELHSPPPSASTPASPQPSAAPAEANSTEWGSLVTAAQPEDALTGGVALDGVGGGEGGEVVSSHWSVVRFEHEYMVRWEAERESEKRAVAASSQCKAPVRSTRVLCLPSPHMPCRHSSPLSPFLPSLLPNSPSPLQTPLLDGVPVVSELTLALFQDSGWYAVTPGMAGMLRAGYHRGCPAATATLSCPPSASASASATTPPGFCSAADLNRSATFSAGGNVRHVPMVGRLWGGGAVGDLPVDSTVARHSSPASILCLPTHLSPPPSSPRPSRPFQPPPPPTATDVLLRLPLGRHLVESQRCQAPRGAEESRSAEVQQLGMAYGPSSRCFLHGPQFFDYAFGAGAVPPPGAGCYPMRCVPSASSSRDSRSAESADALPTAPALEPAAGGNGNGSAALAPKAQGGSALSLPASSSTPKRQLRGKGKGKGKKGGRGKRGGGMVVEVRVGAQWYACPSGRMVALDQGGGDFHGGSIGPCPDNRRMCLTASCPNDCSGKGICYNSTCYCLPGYAATDCSQVACSPLSLTPASTCRAPASCDHASGLCLLPSGRPSPLPLAAAPPYTPPPPPSPPAPPVFPLPGAPPAPGSTVNNSTGSNTNSSSNSSMGGEAPQHGVLVRSVVVLGGANISAIREGARLQEFQAQFQAQMSAAARATGYEGQVEVAIEAIYAGSILVQSTVNFFQATSFNMPGVLLHNLITSPALIFAASSYFLALPSGRISSFNCSMAAAPASNSAPQGAEGPPLGISYGAWAAMAAAILVAGVAICTVLSRRASRRRREALLYAHGYDATGAPWYMEGEEYEEDMEADLDLDLDPLEAYAQSIRVGRSGHLTASGQLNPSGQLRASGQLRTSGQLRRLASGQLQVPEHLNLNSSTTAYPPGNTKSMTNASGSGAWSYSAMGPPPHAAPSGSTDTTAAAGAGGGGEHHVRMSGQLVGGGQGAAEGGGSGITGSGISSGIGSGIAVSGMLLASGTWGQMPHFAQLNRSGQLRILKQLGTHGAGTPPMAMHAHGQARQSSPRAASPQASGIPGQSFQQSMQSSQSMQQARRAVSGVVRFSNPLAAAHHTASSGQLNAPQRGPNQWLRRARSNVGLSGQVEMSGRVAQSAQMVRVPSNGEYSAAQVTPSGQLRRHFPSFATSGQLRNPSGPFAQWGRGGSERREELAEAAEMAAEQAEMADFYTRMRNKATSGPIYFG